MGEGNTSLFKYMEALKAKKGFKLYEKQRTKQVIEDSTVDKELLLKVVEYMEIYGDKILIYNPYLFKKI